MGSVPSFSLVSQKLALKDKFYLTPKVLMITPMEPLRDQLMEPVKDQLNGAMA